MLIVTHYGHMAHHPVEMPPAQPFQALKPSVVEKCWTENGVRNAVVAQLGSSDLGTLRRC
jgi:hypothetical protein